MFSYFGSKSKIVHLYPAPKHDLIIEPFAGSARYALKYFERDVILIDKYSTVIEVWKYLRAASPSDILTLPKIPKGCGARVSDYKQLSEIEAKFLGFLVQGGQGVPADTVGSLDGINVARDLKTIAKQLFKIRHWQFVLGEYDCLANVRATWFVDPPYTNGGQHQYKFGNRGFDFEKLARWSEGRNGQAIVCENTSGDWLPFKRLAKIRGTNANTTEVFWTNEPTETQVNLF